MTPERKKAIDMFYNAIHKFFSEANKYFQIIIGGTVLYIVGFMGETWGDWQEHNVNVVSYALGMPVFLFGLLLSSFFATKMFEVSVQYADVLLKSYELAFLIKIIFMWIWVIFSLYLFVNYSDRTQELLNKFAESKNTHVDRIELLETRNPFR